MDAADISPAAPQAQTAAPYEVRRPAGRPAPLIFASPHSGRFYPPDMMSASNLNADQIRRSEDAHVDELISGGLDVGASLICNRYARAYVDVNREPWELDPAMFSDALPDHARGATPRVAAGLGAIARIVADGQEIYARKLTFAEARGRIEAVHAPWHAALGVLIAETVETFNRAVVIDWHSMPSAAARKAQGQRVDFVLGDRFGRSCDPAIVMAAEQTLGGLGYRTAMNNPYAGGFTTETYGRPEKRISALQIEINRALYLDEARVEVTAGFEALRADLARLFAALAAAA